MPGCYSARFLGRLRSSSEAYSGNMITFSTRQSPLLGQDLFSSPLYARQYQVCIAKTAFRSTPTAISYKSRNRLRIFKGGRRVSRGKLTAQAASIDEQGTDSRLPVTILTGFLGSGKTTMLNNVLSQNHGRRIAIVENEFGNIDIDSRLIQAKEVVEGVEIVESLNGCACCTVRGDLMEALIKLIANKKGKFDHIIIETTGLAEPGPIISIFYTTELANFMKVDGVVTMVDAKNVERHLDQEIRDKDAVNEALQQIAYADRIILNKTDLVEEGPLMKLEERLRRVNGLAQIRKAQNAAVSVDYVIGVGGHDFERIDEELNNRPVSSSNHSHEEQHETTQSPEGTSHSHSEHSHSEHSHSDTSSNSSGVSSHEEHHTHSVSHGDGADGHIHDAYHSHHSHSHDHKHDDSVTSVSITIEEDLNLEMVNDWLCSVLEAMSNDLFRYKGILAIHGEPEQYIFQGVHEQVMAVQSRKWGPGEKRRSQMVFIGRDIGDGLLEEGFKSCIQKQPAETQV